MIVYNYDADLEVSDTCVRSSLLICVELSRTVVFRSLDGRWHGNQILLVSKWMGVAGWRRLVAQPGGLTLGGGLCPASSLYHSLRRAGGRLLNACLHDRAAKKTSVQVDNSETARVTSPDVTSSSGAVTSRDQMRPCAAAAGCCANRTPWYMSPLISMLTTIELSYSSRPPLPAQTHTPRC